MDSGQPLRGFRNDTAGAFSKLLAAFDTPRAGALIGAELKRLIRAFDNLRVDGARLSEDYSFCHRWRSLCGGEIWANTQHTITHVGLRHFAAPFDKARRGPRIMVGKFPAAVKTKPARNPGGSDATPSVRVEAESSPNANAASATRANSQGNKPALSKTGQAFLNRLRNAVDKATEQ